MKVKYFTLPNIITLGNLACGTMAAICAVSHIWSPEVVSLKVPLLFILASAVLDFCDGLAARLTGQYSALGVQLDSLADMVSFGTNGSKERIGRVLFMILFVLNHSLNFF